MLSARALGFRAAVDSEGWVEAAKLYKALYELSPPEAINYVWFDAGTRFSQRRHRDVLLVDAVLLPDEE